MAVIVYLTNRTCRACGEPVGCLGKDWADAEKTLMEMGPDVIAIDCETGEKLERCPHCGEGGRWWEEEDDAH